MSMTAEDLISAALKGFREAEAIMSDARGIAIGRVDAIRNIVPTLEKWDKTCGLLEDLVATNIAHAHAMKKVSGLIGSILNRVEALERS